MQAGSTDMIAQKIHSIVVSELPHPEWAESADPHSNTGSNSLLPNSSTTELESRIDNVSLLWKLSEGWDIRDSIDRILGIKFDINIQENRKIGIVWHRTWSSVTGTLYSQRDTVDGQVYCRLSLSGEDCARAGNLQLRSFLRWCATNLCNLTCSRIDLAVDDYNKILNYQDIEQALRDGEYTGFRAGRVTVNYGEKFGGFTVNLGSRSSEKFVRFYDKFAESHGVLDCYRFEVELKDNLANAMFALVLEFPDNEQEYQRKIIDYAVSSVDFVEKTDKNIGRNLRLGWWDAWLSRLKCTRILVKISRVKTSISAKKNWVQRSVAKSLLMIQKSIGVERLEHFLLNIMHEAESRISRMDELMLSDYATNGHLCYMASIIE